MNDRLIDLAEEVIIDLIMKLNTKDIVSFFILIR